MNVELPSNFDSEVIILGSILANVDSVNAAMGKLESFDFSDFRHELIFSAMEKLYRQDHVIEPETVYMEMDTDDKSHLAYLYELTQYRASYEIDAFIQKVKDASKLRRYIYLAKASIEQAASQETNPETFIAELSKKTDSIFSGVTDSTQKKPHQILENYQDSNLSFIDYLQNRQERRANGETLIRGLSTGYRNVDTTMSGLCRGHMIIVAARPGVGKTTFVINIMKKMLEKNIPILFFSMEMTADEIVGKIIAMDSGVNYSSFDDGTISVDEFHKLLESSKKVEKYPFYIEDQEDLTPAKIKSRVRRNIETHGIQAVFLDYLTCMNPDRRTNTREEGVREISDALKKMAKFFKIPFVCVAQENRESEKADGKQRLPKKSDLGQSGGIEQDAHTIIMLRRPEQDDPLDKPGIMQAYFVKNRFGMAGTHIKKEFPFNAATGAMGEFSV